MIAQVSSFFRSHPMLKGMAVYSVIWPTSSVVQQWINSEDFDWKKSLRFFMFGTFFVAPTLYGWIKLTTHMWPQMSLKTGMQKAVLEQFTYGPAAGVSFFTLMTLMEGRGFDDVKSELTEKFPKTYKGD
jgi:protein Mpv17